MPPKPGAPYQRPLYQYFSDLPGGYTATIKVLDSGEFYWHAYRRDERFNGGINESRSGALKDAEAAITRDCGRFSPLWFPLESELSAVRVSLRG
jgi:hypothetical protein